MHSNTTIHFIENREAEARRILAQDHTQADADAEKRLSRDIEEAHQRMSATSGQ